MSSDDLNMALVVLLKLSQHAFGKRGEALVFRSSPHSLDEVPRHLWLNRMAMSVKAGSRRLLCRAVDCPKTLLVCHAYPSFVTIPQAPALRRPTIRATCSSRQ